MTEKAVLVAADTYDRLLADSGGDLTQPWAKVKAAMAGDKATKDLVEFLPKRLDLAIKRERKERLVKGRPRGPLASSGTVR